MAYYDALIAKWQTLSGSTDAKLAAVNALTVAGPKVDVQMPALVGYLALNGKLSALLAYAASAPATEAGMAAKELAALFASPNAPSFGTSNSTIYATVEGFLAALVGDTSSGITAADQTAIMALAATAIPWWQASIAQGGAGLSGPVGEGDLVAAGGLT